MARWRQRSPTARGWVDFAKGGTVSKASSPPRAVGSLNPCCLPCQQGAWHSRLTKVYERRCSVQGEIGLADRHALRKVLGNVTSSHVTSNLSLCPSHDSSDPFHKRSLRVSRPDALCPVSCSALSTAEAATARAHSHTHGLDSVTPSPHIGLANDGGGVRLEATRRCVGSHP